MTSRRSRGYAHPCPGFGEQGCLTMVPDSRVLCYYHTKSKRPAEQDCECGGLASADGHEVSLLHLRWQAAQGKTKRPVGWQSPASNARGWR